MDLMFGKGSTPNKGPDEAPSEQAPENALPEEAPTDDESPEDRKSTGSGKQGAEESANANREGNEEEEDTRGADKPKWTSNLSSWFSAWKDGGEVQVRKLDTLDALGVDGIIMQGQVWKKGVHAGDAFLSRWVTVNKSNISYSVGEGEPVIDHIAFADIIAVCYHKPTVEPDSTAEEAKAINENTVTTMHHRDSDANEHCVDEIKDHTKDFMESAASLSVNIMFRDEIYEEEIQHVKDLKLSASDFAVITSKHGYQRGRIFVFRAENKDSSEQWSQTLIRVMGTYAGVPVEKASLLSRVRRSVRWFYVGDSCQVTHVAFFLFGWHACVPPPPSHYRTCHYCVTAPHKEPPCEFTAQYSRHYCTCQNRNFCFKNQKGAPDCPWPVT